jgi:hypothetical protein
VSGIIQPGHIYILCSESERGGYPEPIEFMYTIRAEHEILPAIDMEMNIVLASMYDLRKFCGVGKISDNCHQFKMVCYDKEGDRTTLYSLYLHRIMSFEEGLKSLKELYMDSEFDA